MILEGKEDTIDEMIQEENSEKETLGTINKEETNQNLKKRKEESLTIMMIIEHFENWRRCGVEN